MVWFYVLLLCQISATRFHDFSFEEINDHARALVGRFASVHLASELWGNELRSPKCSPLLARVTDFHTLDKYLTTRPQLVLSGALHGDERVGPTSVTFTAELLVWAGQCQLLRDQMSCERLTNLRVTESQIIWLAFLATKRDTYFIPTPNCMGYLNHQRSDQGVDPNRDFPYSRGDGKCLVSKTALVLDALFRNVTVQTLITFHGGMAAIGYEWGSVQHPRGRDKCPDNLAHSMIAQSFVTFSGGFKGQKPYSAAPINSIVYPVEGGMEDWAYAAGWDTELNSKCDGRSSQAVPPPNRAVTFLVETSDKKSPPASEMGHDIGILDYDTSQQYGGHVSRNTRLSLVGIDTVQPYVCFAKVASSPSPHTLSVSWYVGGGFEVKSTWISWHIPPSHLMSRLLTISDSSEFSEILEQFVHSVSPPSPPILGHEKWIPQNKAARFHASGWFSGPARWKWKNPFDYNEGLFEVHEVHLPFNISQFHKRDRRSAKSRRYSLELNTSHHQSSPRSLSEIDNHEITLLLVAWAEVDSDWGTPGQGYPATLSDPKHIRARRLRAQFPPQSHLSHARSNPDWKVVNALGETKILGRRYFPSDPVVVKVAAKEGQHRMSHFMTNVEIQSSVHHCASWSRRKGSREGEDH